MLRRTGLGAFGVLVGFAMLSPANADDPAIKDPDDPGVDIIIKDPGSTAGTNRPAIEKSESNDDKTFRANLGNVCTGNIGASSVGTLAGASLADRLDRMAACSNAPEPEGVDAVALARTARDRLDLATPQIHTSPEAPVKALVGLETWMWVPSSQWTALTESATLGGTTVTVRAEPISTRWDMGEATKFCPNPGRVWRKGLGQDATTPCGYTYEHTSLRQPDNKYQISGQIRYAVTWTCTGDCSAPSGNLGTIDSVASTAALEVGERHSVVIR
jgi:hypothetical protein